MSGSRAPSSARARARVQRQGVSSPPAPHTQAPLPITSLVPHPRTLPGALLDPYACHHLQEAFVAPLPKPGPPVIASHGTLL